ncbi:MAG: YbjQ family protein [Rhizobiaceae bacterium]
MILSTTATIAHKEITKTLGLVQGTTIRARHVGVDIVASIKILVGGELTGYTKMMAGAREQAMDRMVASAEALNADAVVEIRMTTSTVTRGAAEILCYGTAVNLR